MPRKGLTPKQKAFVEAYAGNATEAAIKAGYSKRGAEAAGSRLLRNVNILAQIDRRESKRAEKRIATRRERQKFWTEVMNNGDHEMRDRLKASELLGKSEADFIDRFDGRLEGGLTVKAPDLKIVVTDGRPEND